MWMEDCHWLLFTDSILEEGWGYLVHDGPLSPGMGWGGFGPPHLFRSCYVTTGFTCIPWGKLLRALVQVAGVIYRIVEHGERGGTWPGLDTLPSRVTKAIDCTGKGGSRFHLLPCRE